MASASTHETDALHIATLVSRAVESYEKRPFGELERTRVSIPVAFSSNVSESGNSWHVTLTKECISLAASVFNLKADVHEEGRIVSLTVFYRYRFVDVVMRVGKENDTTAYVEWSRFSGDVCDFCDMYRKFARLCVSKYDGCVDVSGFADEERSYEEKHDGHLIDLGCMTDEECSEVIAVIVFQLCSIWSTTQMEGCCLLAKTCESNVNVHALLKNDEIMKKLGELVRSEYIGISTPACAAVLNMYKSVRDGHNAAPDSLVAGIEYIRTHVCYVNTWVKYLTDSLSSL